MNPRHRRLLIPGLLVVLVVVVVIASLTGKAEASQIDDPRITESSGLAASRSDADLVYTINDSGSDPRIFAIEVSSGRTVGVTTLTGVDWVDPEAMSIDAEGRLWIADTGDNTRSRSTVQLYVLAEPGRSDSTVRPDVLTVQLPGGPADVEALAISDNQTVLVTKGITSGSVLRLEHSGEAAMQASSVASAPGLVTDAAFSNDGLVLFLRTYLRVHALGAGTFTELDSFDPGRMGQSETLAVLADDSLLIGAEGESSPLVRVDWTPQQSFVAASALLGLKMS